MKYSRIFDLVENLKTNYEDKNVLVAKKDGDWVYYNVSEYLKFSKQFALGLMALGFKKGDKVVTVTNNRPEWNFVDMGMSMVGVVHVPIYPTISDEEYRFILKHSDARLLLISDVSLFNRLNSIANEIDTIQGVYTFNDIEGAKHWSEITDLGESKRVILGDE